MHKQGRIINIDEEEKYLNLEVSQFNLLQRKSMLLSKSAFFPQELKSGQDMGVANSAICYELADRLGLGVLEVVQNINIIHGKPSFSVKFQLARLYNSGLIKGFMQFKEDNNATECTAYATMVDGTLLEGITVTMEMAEKEGWKKTVGRGGQAIASKYDSMPRLMLRKRATSFWISDYAPQILLGLDSNNNTDDDEMIETYITPPVNEIVSVESFDTTTGEVFEITDEIEETIKQKCKLEGD